MVTGEEQALITPPDAPDPALPTILLGGMRVEIEEGE